LLEIGCLPAGRDLINGIIRQLVLSKEMEGIDLSIQETGDDRTNGKFKSMGSSVCSVISVCSDISLLSMPPGH
jgi:hypothetical protein